MTLLYPAFLWFLIPLAILWYSRPKNANNENTSKTTLADSVHLIILFLIILALSRPAIEAQPVKGEIEARDLIIALDVSYSMRAQDIHPDRYTYAKETINQLLTSNHTDNIMLIAFTTNPLLLSPPTTDHALISLAMESLNSDNILTHGTSLSKLFDKVATLPMQDKTLLLLTDGGEDEDLPVLEKILVDHQISLIVLALGTRSGTTIQKDDGSMLKDDKGDLVVSRVNPQLETLTEQTGGHYITAPSTPKAAAEALQSKIDTLSIERHTISKMQQRHTELYQIPLAFAILLFLFLHTRAVKYLLPLAALWGGQANASIFDAHTLHQAYAQYQSQDYNATELTLQTVKTPSLQSQIAKANTYYKQGRYAKAALVYRSIRSRSPKIKQMLHYNLGNCYAQTKAYDKAIKHYSKALQLGEDEDSRYNLNYVVLKKSKAANSLNFARPKSQGDKSAQDQDPQEEDEESAQEQQSSGSSGGGGGSDKTKERAKKKLLYSDKEETKQEQPLSSRVYDLINKGYVHEKAPW